MIPSPSQADLTVQKETIVGIPVTVVFQEDSTGKPLILLSHGFTETKESWSDRQEQLAASGYCVVAFDNRGHGERTDRPFGERVFRDGRLDVLEIRKLIRETSDDVPVLIDHMVDAFRIDANRVAMAGISMGGFTTFRALTIDPRIRVAAPLIASPFWDDIPGDVPSMTDPASLLELATYSATYSPALVPEYFYPCALFFQIGGQDRHYHPARVHRFFDTLRPYYAERPDRLKFRIEPDTGHVITPLMWNLVVDWLETHL